MRRSPTPTAKAKSGRGGGGGKSPSPRIVSQAARKAATAPSDESEDGGDEEEESEEDSAEEDSDPGKKEEGAEESADDEDTGWERADPWYNAGAHSKHGNSLNFMDKLKVGHLLEFQIYDDRWRGRLCVCSPWQPCSPLWQPRALQPTIAATCLGTSHKSHADTI